MLGGVRFFAVRKWIYVYEIIPDAGRHFAQFFVSIRGQHRKFRVVA
jgi:hypothetical protein